MGGIVNMQMGRGMVRWLRKERIPFVLLAMLCSFCITFEHAVSKSSINSLFISHYGAKNFPLAWIVSLPINLFVVASYNRFINTLGAFRFLLGIMAATMGVNALLAYGGATYAPLAFLMGVWKDIYVLLLFQQLWSIIHSSSNQKESHSLYGVLFGVGGVGSVVGSLIPGFFAVSLGSSHLLFFCLPIGALLATAYLFLLRQSGVREDISPRGQWADAWEGFALIRSSPTLRYILMIVLFMQVSATLMDLKYNAYLGVEFPNQDLRTQFSGRLWSCVNGCNFLLQFFAAFALVRWVGERRTHLALPIILLGLVVQSACMSSFFVTACCFAALKVFDYSIFNIMKEWLYVPMRQEEKFKAKAVIDVFIYRAAKGIAAIGWFCTQGLARWIGAIDAMSVVSWLIVAMHIGWLGGVLLFLRKRNTSASSQPTLSS
ncbi:MAG: Npt1/Npt2 family nucleotide transporter [Chlamydiota bacterium]|nr:Npt1/Npt2 family nucleotide transporter [Chlamydiota bacterium]